MPFLLHDMGVILPTLKAYTAASVLALSACVYFATQTIKDPNWKNGADEPDSNENVTNTLDFDHMSWGHLIYQVFSVMIREPVSVWTMINMAFCWLILMSKCVQQFVFGELRVSEQQHLKDKFWNFMFYKFIFVFGIVNVQYIDEVLLWCSWFALLGFLHLLSQLGKDRFEYLSFSPTTPAWSHAKLLGLLGCILALSGFMFLVCVFVGFFVGFNTFAFMVAEVVLLFIKTLHTIIKYVLHLYDMRQDGSGVVASSDAAKTWERRGPIVYYIELVFEVTALTVDFMHHSHMLLGSNIFLSMASLVICMQIRFLFYEIQERFKRHRNYVLVRNHLEQNYPMASIEELADNSDNCAICWEKMEAARKLPCTHLFHNACLQSWLEQHTSCPTCRMTLSIHSSLSNRPQEVQPDNLQPIRRQLNFFHFDGSRYVSWLPSFSVEVTQSLRSDRMVATNSQLDANARQVQQLFPHIPIPTIMEDLRVTRSVEQTVENIIDGRLVAPPIYREENPTPHVDPNTLLLLLSESSAATSRTWEDVSSENVDSDEPVSLAGRFSKSSSERERILNKRKEQMRHIARKRYIEKQRLTSNGQSLSQS